ncbi:hypothetical protein Hanom_Chr11g00982021 [Helianthus anomalus]
MNSQGKLKHEVFLLWEVGFLNANNHVFFLPLFSARFQPSCDRPERRSRP